MSTEDLMDLGIPGLSPATMIGEGGNAVVYRCRQESLDRDVAVKLLKRSSDEGTQRRFSREQRAMGRMSQHDGILTVYDSGITEEGQMYLVMPLLERSLADEMEATGGLPWAGAVDVMAQVSETVEFAHQAGLIHRDLKPENLMRSSSGRPLVADFGISRIVDAGMSVQSTALTLTPAYSPPESFEGVEAAATADVYALGATLYALIEGQPPFFDSTTSSNVLSLIRRVADDPLPPLTAESPDWVGAVIAAAMAKDPTTRVQTAGELATLLRSEGAGLAPTTNATLAAPQPTPATMIVAPTPRPVASVEYPVIAPAQPVAELPDPSAASGAPGSKRPLLIAAAAVLALALVGGGVLFASRGGDSPDADTALDVVADAAPPAAETGSGTTTDPAEAEVPGETAAPALDQPADDVADDGGIVPVVSRRVLLPSEFGMARVVASDPVIGFSGYAAVSEPDRYQPERLYGEDVSFYVDASSTTNAFYREWLLYRSGGGVDAVSADIPQSWIAATPGALPTYPENARSEPVTGISLESARAYCGYVNKRLVSEVEWELAATGELFVADAVQVRSWVDDPTEYGVVTPGAVVLRGAYGTEQANDYYRTIGADDAVLRAAAAIRCASDEVRQAVVVDAPREEQTFYTDDFSDLESGWPSTVPDGVSSVGYHPTDVFHVETELPGTRVVVLGPSPAPADSTVISAIEIRKPADEYGQFRYGLVARSSDLGYVVLTVRPEVEGANRYLNWCLAESASPLGPPDQRLLAQIALAPATTCDGMLAEGRVAVDEFITLLSLSFDGQRPSASIDGTDLVIPPDVMVSIPAGTAGFYVESFDEIRFVHLHYEELLITS